MKGVSQLAKKKPRDLWQYKRPKQVKKDIQTINAAFFSVLVSLSMVSGYLAMLTGDILMLSCTTFNLTPWISFCRIRGPWCTPKQHPVEHLRQLSGSKCWTLLDDSRSNPRAEVMLAPKDVMYLPQGHRGYGG